MTKEHQRATHEATNVAAPRRRESHGHMGFASLDGTTSGSARQETRQR